MPDVSASNDLTVEVQGPLRELLKLAIAQTDDELCVAWFKKLQQGEQPDTCPAAAPVLEEGDGS
jgi:hypothetical protein